MLYVSKNNRDERFAEASLCEKISEQLLLLSSSPDCLIELLFKVNFYELP